MIGPGVVLLENGQNIRVSRSFTSTLSTLRKKRSSTYQHFGMTRICTRHDIITQSVHIMKGNWSPVRIVCFPVSVRRFALSGVSQCQPGRGTDEYASGRISCSHASSAWGLPVVSTVSLFPGTVVRPIKADSSGIFSGVLLS